MGIQAETQRDGRKQTASSVSLECRAVVEGLILPHVSAAKQSDVLHNDRNSSSCLADSNFFTLIHKLGDCRGGKQTKLAIGAGKYECGTNFLPHF